MLIERMRQHVMAVVFKTALLLLLAVGLISSGANAADRKSLWQSRDQFVALESLEKADTSQNNHPVEISPESFAELLATIEIRSEEDGKAEALFTPDSLQALASPLQKAFHSASSINDITFAVIGLYKSGWGFAKTPKVTTGRLFYRDGHLNLIFGQVQQDVNEREDRRLAPFVPGSRKEAASGAWQLVQKPGQDVFKLIRKDWIVFNDVSGTVNIKKTADPEIKPAKHESTVVLQPQKPSEISTPAERFIILNDLRSKGLISEDEFQSKRKQILNTL